jgi:predicted RNA methylase
MCNISGLTYQRYVEIHTKLHSTFDPTPQSIVEAMLKHVHLTRDDLLYDIGCGDGRIVKTATQKYGCKSLGIEINPNIAAIAKENVKNIKGVKIQVADATKLNLDKATVVTFYLDQETMDKIVPKLKGATRIVSYNHPIKKKGTKKIGNIYVWDIFRGGVK